MSDGSVTFEFKLDYNNFKNGVGEAHTILDNFIKSVNSIDGGNFLKSGRELNSVINDLIKSLKEMNGLLTHSISFNTFASGIQKIVNSMVSLKTNSISTKTEIKGINDIFKYLSINSLELNADLVKVKSSESQVTSETAELSSQFAKLSSDLVNVKSNTAQLDSNLDKLGSELKETSSSGNSASQSVDRLGNETKSTSSDIQNINSKLNTMDSNLKKVANSSSYLGRALRDKFSDVFRRITSDISQSITETYKAKSEMQSWFDVMGMSSSQIDSFNSKLDETVAQFQRVNKYGMGETIASLGVEFSLTEAEMEKAMKTTAMVTNEYLRAGRSTSEANLAIKDILQGQFQRLSRETGVGEKDLMAAGWSGDTTDVMGILNALEKIAKDRNWDTIAQKATSINDIMLIGQNRISEWASELIDRFTPTLTDLFNKFMGGFNTIQPIVDNLLDWLGGNGIEQNIVKWGSLASAILIGGNALVSYRTGVSAVQLAHRGLLSTLTATILGLDGETVATYGSRNAILSKITGLNAEKVAEVGTKNAILSKIYGLDAELIKEKGLVGAIRESIAVRQAETIEEELNTVSKEENRLASDFITISEQKESLQRQKNLGFISEETLQEKLNALAKEEEAIATDTATVSNLGLAGAIDILTASFYASPVGWFALAILGLAGAVYVLSGGLDEVWEKTKRYHDTLSDSLSVIQPYKDALNQAKQKYGETSDEAKNAQESLDNVTQSIEHGKYWNDEYNKSFEGIDAKLDSITRKELGDLGYTDEQIDSVSELHDVMYDGADRDYHALQVLHKQQSDFTEGVKGLGKKLKDLGIEGKPANEVLEKYEGNMANLQKHSAIANTTDDWWEWMWNSLYAGMDQFWINWDNFWLDPNWTDGLNGLWDSIKHINPLAGLTHALGLDNFDIGKKVLEAWNGLWDFINKSGDSYNIWADGFNKWANDGIEGAKKQLHENINNFLTFDWLKEWLTELPDPIQWIADWIAQGGANIDFSFVDDWIDNIKKPFIDFISFDWLFVSASDGSSDHPEVGEEMYQVIVQPIVDWWNGFMSDPLGTLETGQLNIASFLDGIFGTDFEGITLWVQDSIINPFAQGVSDGIASIPIIGDIAGMLGLVSNESQDAHDTGYNLIDYLKQGVEQKIGEIPIVGDIARMLGLIPQQNQNAHSKGHGVGDNIKQGEAEGHKGTADNVKTEMDNIVSAISSKVSEVYSSAYNIGSQILSGIQNALKMHSPSVISREILPKEFGEYIPNAILSGSDAVYGSAVSYAENIKQGIVDSGVSNISMDGMVTDYQDDAQIISDSSQMMGITTTTAFNDMQLSVNDTTNQMANNVNTQYTSMQQKQASLLSNMKTSNTNAYNELYQKTNTSLLQMRSSTENVTTQMTDAWKLMKNNIVTSANQLKTESIQHFDKLSTNIGNFYRKIQNPSNWGAGEPTRRTVSRSPSSGRRLLNTTKYGAGASPYHGRSTSMSIDDLMRMVGISDSTKVDLNTFLQSIMGEHGYGWSDWHTKHYTHIKNTSDKWKTAPPMIMGRIKTGNGYLVGDFNTGQPSLGWNDFVETAEDLFSAIPYAFYYDSQKWGSWQNALEHGEANCSDGSDALIALASVFGFGGSKVHTTTKSGVGHYYAIINGHKMDTTNFQQSRSWNPLGGAGVVRGSYGAGATTNKTINVTVNVNGTVYGVDDLNSKIEEGVDKGLQKHFNNNYAIGV